MEMWNRMTLNSPPVMSDKYVLEDLNKSRLRDVHTKLFASVEANKACESELTEELHLLSRIYYKFKNQWRREKCLRNIKQVEGLLKKFQLLKVTNCLNQLLSLISGKLSRKNEHIYLPSRSLVEFTLIRLMGVTQLLLRICCVCETGYRNIRKQLSAGLFVQNMTIITAIFSKTNCLCKALNEVLCQCYTSLKIWLPDLKPAATSLISSVDKLPDDINSWLIGGSATSAYKQPVAEENSSSLPHQFNCHSSAVPRTSHVAVVPINAEDSLMDEDFLSDIGQVIDRDIFKNHLRDNQSISLSIDCEGIKNQIKDSRQNQSISASESLAPCDLKFPAGKRVKKFLKSVSILDDEDSDNIESSKPVKYAEVSMSEFYDWKAILRDCNNVKEVKQVMRKINDKYSHLRGMKVCIRKLKELKPGMERKKNKNNRKKQKCAKECLNTAQKCVRVMLKKNVKDFVKQKAGAADSNPIVR